MRRFATIAFVVGCVFCAGFARAQDPSAPLAASPVDVPAAAIMDLSRDQDAELRQWLDAMEKWRRRIGEDNRVAHGVAGNIVPRRPQPPEPAWLPDYCRPFGDDPVTLTGRFGAACRLFAERTAEITAEAPKSTAAAAVDREKTEHSSFLSRVHLDGLWLNPSTDGRTYGLLGSHISLVDVGRIQVFGPPGVLLLRVPSGTGSYETRVGYTWGFSVRLVDLRLFAATRNVTLFVSLTKCWMAGGGAQALASPSFDLVGFSIAPRKRSP